jgi:glycerol kinase
MVYTMNILAIDQGTSATKALVLAPSGEVLGSGAADVHPVARPGGSVEQDAGELFGSIVAAGRAALRGAGTEVGAVGLGNQGETVLRWDRASGEPLGPAISWQDRRAARVVAGMEASAARLTELTGLPLDPYFAAPKLTMLRREAGPEGVVSTVDAWLHCRLTGRFATDAATASRTALLDLDRGEWSREACELFQLGDEELPEVVDNDTTLGETTAFGPPLPVTGLAVDQQAALFAESCFEPGQAKCTYGTGAFLLANAGARAPRSRSGLAACVAWRLRGETSYCLDGQIYAAGAAITWLSRIGLVAEPSQLDSFVAEANQSDPVIFVPGLAGLGAPFWAPEARAGWLGLSLASGRAEMVRAVLDGIAAHVALLARASAADLGRPLTRLRVDGGLARSAALLQAQADLLQLPVERYPHADATARGVGAFAALGAGLASDPASAVGEWRPQATFEPRVSADEAEARLAAFRAAAEALIAAAGS